MTTDPKLRYLATALEKNPGVCEAEVAAFTKAAGVTLPGDYLSFMRTANGAEGFVGDGEYLRLWPIRELLESNLDYLVQERAPGLFLFGTTGGGQAFAFDTRQEGMPIVMVPFDALSLEEAQPCGSTFDEFFEFLARR